VISASALKRSRRWHRNSFFTEKARSSVKYDRIGVVLINAVKEQQAQIEQQKEQLKRQQEQDEVSGRSGKTAAAGVCSNSSTL
jgi:hypothetical protein